MTHNKDPRNRGIKCAKPVLGIYYLTHDWKLRFRKISRLLVPYYRSKLWKRRRFVCLECGGKFLCLVKKYTNNQLVLIVVLGNENQDIMLI